jgi:hypothetical protein
MWKKICKRGEIVLPAHAEDALKSHLHNKTGVCHAAVG